ncbi:MULTISPECIES: hypothetical protein [unclassified Serratia (in: enterobacteria)]|uniref:hypothetical protein n=1 Tax=unclassified Serratia (in: enterobacteria) TaxID=2647522 RepID=UPI003075F0DA
MNGIYAFLAPILLLLSVVSFIIHFRNERKKTLIERPFHAAKQETKEVAVTAQNNGQAAAQPCCTHTFCRFCPIAKRVKKTPLGPTVSDLP